jgi:hypothetical protein
VLNSDEAIAEAICLGFTQTGNCIFAGCCVDSDLARRYSPGWLAQGVLQIEVKRANCTLG